MPPKHKLNPAKDSQGSHLLTSFGVTSIPKTGTPKIIRPDASPPPGLDTTYEKWDRQNYKTIHGADSHKTLHLFLLSQASLRGLATGQQNSKNHFLKFLIQKYDELLAEDNKLPPQERKALSYLANAALVYSNQHPNEVAALEATTGGEVDAPGLEMPPLQPLTAQKWSSPNLDSSHSSHSSRYSSRYSSSDRYQQGRVPKNKPQFWHSSLEPLPTVGRPGFFLLFFVFSLPTNLLHSHFNRHSRTKRTNRPIFCH